MKPPPQYIKLIGGVPKCRRPLGINTQCDSIQADLNDTNYQVSFYPKKMPPKRGGKTNRELVIIYDYVLHIFWFFLNRENQQHNNQDWAKYHAKGGEYFFDGFRKNCI